MKKSNLFLTLVCVLFCFIASSCNFAEIFDVDETKNEWYYQPFEYETEQGTLYLDCYLLYSDGNYKVPSKFKEDLEIGDGLTMVVVPNVERTENASIIDLFFESSKTYLKYNFPKGKSLADSELVKDDVTSDGTDNKKFNIYINDKTWSALYLACLTGETEDPYVLKKSSGYEEGFKLTAKKLSVKKLLAGLILKYLEE